MIRKFIHGARQPFAYSLFAALTSVLLIGGGGAWYVQHATNEAVDRANRAAAEAIRQSELKQCTVFVLLDQVYQRTPPTTDLGRSLAVAVHRQVQDLRCYDKVTPSLTPTPLPRESR